MPAVAHDANVIVPESVAAEGPAVTKQGLLAVIHSDDFQKRKSTFGWVLHDEKSGKHTHLRFKSKHAPQVGKIVSVSGSLLGDGATMNVDQMTVLADAAVSALSSKNVIFILVKFMDSGADPFTQDAVSSVATSRVENFFLEASY